MIQSNCSLLESVSLVLSCFSDGELRATLLKPSELIIKVCELGLLGSHKVAGMA